MFSSLTKGQQVLKVRGTERAGRYVLKVLSMMNL